MEYVQETLKINTRNSQNIFGALDKNLRSIEKQLGVSIVYRNELVSVSGEKLNVAKAVNALKTLDSLSDNGGIINSQRIDYILSIDKDSQDNFLKVDKETVYHTQSGKPIRPKTLGQKAYVKALEEKMIVFGIGPAGTGKTYLAIAMAIKAFKLGEVSRIILTRPAIEAGEKLGFLPGDLQSKIDPYLRPLYDALYQIMGAENVIKNMEKGLIEVAPLAYMRGRTLDNSFIILDEAQNTTASQMKMFLTRIGFNSKVAVTGDSTQKDLPRDVRSGLDVAEKVLKKIDDIAFIHLTSLDVVRHPLVQKIVKAYEAYEEKKNRRKAT